MEFVDEQDRFRSLLERCNQRLETFFEVAAVAGSGEKRARIEGEDLGVSPSSDPRRASSRANICAAEIG